MNVNVNRTEDEVRDSAKLILGFESTKTVNSGCGQITTFNQLGFPGVADKPDGWYLPKDKNEVAIILETKAENIDIDTKKCVEEIRKNCTIAMTQYGRVVGILYNGIETRAFKNNSPIDVPNELQGKAFYIKKFTEESIDKELIFRLTARINNCLHSEFGIKNLYHRMIFTACALVAERYNKNALMMGMDYATFHQSILSTLSKSLADSRKQNQKLDTLLEVYAEIRMNSTENQVAIDNFIGWVKDISASINSNHWRGEDVMGIFFNEFNRYKKKSESGQVFTPDHITSFMYRILGCTMDDYILDATCGSGAFLVKAMSNMMVEAGGVDTNKAKSIKSNHLFGIEFDREIFALACANMLIHKDGKTNLEQMDTRTDKACEWMQSKPITKVMMNPPYENKYGCIKIVENVLNSVSKGTLCAFILPDKKLEKVSQKAVKRILNNHRLIKIIKMPEALFFGQGVTTSIFVFEVGTPQKGKEIFGCYLEDDGLETVKNQGRHDIKGKWADIEDYWADSVYKQADAEFNTGQWINPKEHLSYQTPEKPFEIFEEDFRRTAMNYLMFQDGINTKEFGDKLLNAALYSGDITATKTVVTIKLAKDGEADDAD
ncbi:MAG: SAM-dependent methyltransferase [Oscillospiraceae bacterium]|nr:SAM-dependent methyltransferase [Oscillospiraceae bacterium]